MTLKPDRRLTTEEQLKLFGCDLIDLLRREGRHSGVSFSSRLIQAADELESRTLPLDGDVVERVAKAMAEVIAKRHGHETTDWINDERREEARAAITATRSGDGELREALEQARAAIMQAAKDTLWCDETCPAETVVDKIDAALSSIRDR